MIITALIMINSKHEIMKAPECIRKSHPMGAGYGWKMGFCRLFV